MNIYSNLPLKTFLMSCFFLAACSKGEQDPEVKPVPDELVVVTKAALKMGTNTNFGTVLMDQKGKTLYFFSMDANGTSGCTGGCETVWPVFYAEDATVPAGMTSTDMATITRADGKKQTTFKGWPLYYYASDVNNGDVKGDGVGGNWFVAKPDYSTMARAILLIRRKELG
jgi:predicted lipoprotein with Yx(FWY)xxD motif